MKEIEHAENPHPRPDMHHFAGNVIADVELAMQQLADTQQPTGIEI